MATILTLKRPILPILIPPPKINQVRDTEPGQEPHFDQGHEEYSLLGFQSGIIINLLLQFTGGISKRVLEVGVSAPSHSDVAGSWRSRLVPHQRWRSVGAVSSMSGKTRPCRAVHWKGESNEQQGKPVWNYQYQRVRLGDCTARGH